MVHSEARTRLDNLTKKKKSDLKMHGFLHEMRKCCIFPLCRESVLGRPRIEIEFEFDMVFCFGIRLAPYAVFFFFFFFVVFFYCCFFFFVVVVVVFFFFFFFFFFLFFVFLLLFFFVVVVFFHSDLPSTHCTTC